MVGARWHDNTIGKKLFIKSTIVKIPIMQIDEFGDPNRAKLLMDKEIEYF